jgi:penicillin-binding protein 1A
MILSADPLQTPGFGLTVVGALAYLVAAMPASIERRWPAQALVAAWGVHGLALLAGLAVLAVLLLSLLTLWWSFDLPPLDKAVDYRPRQHLQVLAADGSEIAQFGSERRVFVPIAQTPQALKQAVLAVEDAGFYEHEGISWKGVVRAVWSNLTGGIGGGASTITQQVSRTFFLSTQRTLERKVKEALIARQLEKTLSKDEILELYLNQIYLGQRAYGYGAAAQVYFGKPLAQLNLAESAMLAGLQQNPIYANPINNATAATKRQRWVLERMQRTGAITEAQETEALAFKLVYRKPAFVDVQAQHVAELVVHERCSEHTRPAIGQRAVGDEVHLPAPRAQGLDGPP